MDSPHSSVPSPDDLFSLTRHLLASMDRLDALRRQRGSAADRLAYTVRTADAMHRTSLLASRLLARTALSDAPTTTDGLRAIALLRRLTEATTSATGHVTDAISALAHGDTKASDRLLGQTRAALARTPVAVQDVGAALLRHDGFLYAQDRAARDPTVTGSAAVKVSEAQRKGLAAFARGDAVLRDAYSGGLEVVTPLDAHLRASTIDALVAKKLVDLVPLPGQPSRYGAQLTSSGVRTILEASPVLALPTAVPRPAAARPGTSRPAGARR
ncbi:hypothetical protein [Streptomyces microflavus]|uniref:hypothetical protein n=1 Tax=Streptomyces microflavus TaxID=1919 RepID=UPI002E315637|nr:hypothetical protein [Streptomyces microflavus]